MECSRPECRVQSANNDPWVRVTTHVHVYKSLTCTVCFVNTDGRGFDVRRKLSSVVPDDVTSGGAEKDMSSELFALVSTLRAE